MADKECFETEKAPCMGGPYSQAVIHNGMIYLTAQGPLNPETNKAQLGTIEEETMLSMDNIRTILEEAGSSLEKILQVNVYLLRIKDYSRFNEVYRGYFQKDFPARSCIEAAKLPFGFSVQLSVVAYI
ncbi:Rid family detoxifying hydrolase [Thermodesulfobacteriota bacterium]